MTVANRLALVLYGAGIAALALLQTSGLLQGMGLVVGILLVLGGVLGGGFDD